jgi:hypothetical protein
MPEMIPVGNTIIPPKPIDALGSLSGILGIQQQQQNLQTGQYVQQEQQAAAQQAQQKNEELQAVANLTKNAYTSGRYKNEDGTFNNQQFANDVAQLGPYAQETANAATVRAGEIYQNQKTLFGLNHERRQTIGDAFGALAAQVDHNGQPTVTHDQMIDTIENLRQQNPSDKDYSRMLTSMAASVPPNAPPQQLQQYFRNMAVMTNSPTAAQTDPNMQLIGQNLQNTNPQSPLGTVPPGGKVNTLSTGAYLPQQTTNAQNQILNRDPISGALSLPAQGAGPRFQQPNNLSGQAPNLNPTGAEASTINAAAQGIAQRIQQAKAADYDRPAVLDALTRARAILANPNAPALGSSFEINTYLKNALSSMGVDTGGATNANELVKNLARAEAARSQSSPIGTTDAGRNLLSKGTGSTHIDNAAALNIIDQSIATEMAGRGYLKAVAPFQGDPVKMQAAESRFLSTPHLIHAYELGLKKSPAEVESFKKLNGINNDDLGVAIANLRSLGAL